VALLLALIIDGCLAGGGGGGGVACAFEVRIYVSTNLLR